VLEVKCHHLVFQFTGRSVARCHEGGDSTVHSNSLYAWVVLSSMHWTTLCSYISRNKIQTRNLESWLLEPESFRNWYPLPRSSKWSFLLFMKPEYSELKSDISMLYSWKSTTVPKLSLTQSHISFFKIRLLIFLASTSKSPKFPLCSMNKILCVCSLLHAI
jgi:hypothetical protein